MIELLEKVDNYIIAKIAQPLVDSGRLSGYSRKRIIDILTLLGIFIISLDCLLFSDSLIFIIGTLFIVLLQYRMATEACVKNESSFFNRSLALGVVAVLIIFAVFDVFSEPVWYMKLFQILFPIGWIFGGASGIYIAACKDASWKIAKPINDFE